MHVRLFSLSLLMMDDELSIKRVQWHTLEKNGLHLTKEDLTWVTFQTTNERNLFQSNCQSTTEWILQSVQDCHLDYIRTAPQLCPHLEHHSTRGRPHLALCSRSSSSLKEEYEVVKDRFFLHCTHTMIILGSPSNGSSAAADSLFMRSFIELFFVSSIFPNVKNL